MPRGETGLSFAAELASNDAATGVGVSFTGTTNGRFEMGGLVSRVFTAGYSADYWAYSLFASAYPLRRDIRQSPITIGTSLGYTGIIAPSNPSSDFRDAGIWSGSVNLYLDAPIANLAYLQPTFSLMVSHTTKPSETEGSVGIGLSFYRFTSRRMQQQEANRSFHVSALAVLPRNDIPFTIGVRVGFSSWHLKPFSQREL